MDFALWGSNQQRTAKTMRNIGMIVGSGNTLQHHEFKGPPTYENSLECWIVFETAMIMIEAFIPPWLEARRVRILTYVQEHGVKCWPLLYQQESSYRSERLPCMFTRESDKRDEAIKKRQATPFNPARPWGSLFEPATTDELGPEGLLLRQQYENRALVIVAGVASVNNYLAGGRVIAGHPAAHVAKTASAEVYLGRWRSSWCWWRRPEISGVQAGQN